MGTIADKLELLRRTKERQRAYLEQKYPLLDFDTIPFRAYLDLFQGRSYVPGFVGGWKAYGRSNDEDAGTRKYLHDYSGNGRDIELFNFAFSGMSGYGGYGSTSWMAYGTKAEQTSGNVVDVSLESSADEAAGVQLLSIYKGEIVKIRYKITGYQEGCLLRAYTNTRNSEGRIVPNFVRTITADGIYEDTFEWDSENAATDSTGSQIFIMCHYSKAASAINMTIEQLPLYPGALVSDGVDDYGQCIKGFALPDDYTVVAIRKIPEVGNPGLASKGSTMGAFLFEAGEGGVIAWSYGASTSNSTNTPALFSYQSKNSYNGTYIESGTATDNEDDKLYVFSQIGRSSSGYILYDLRIYDHSLTAEELQTVKDEMMSDYENATGGGIADITYVADWDGKGRSNDEEEPMRSQWIDKATGKVINLSNYSFNEMSGWNGYCFDWSRWVSDIAGNGGTVIRTQTSIRMTNTGTRPGWTIAYISNPGAFGEFRIKVSGLKAGASLVFNAASAGGELLRTNTDGVYTIPAVDTEASSIRFSAEGYSENESADLLIEQLPLYPGALVSDGVDDYGETAEAISEEIGVVVVHGHFIDNNPKPTYYLYSLGKAGDLNKLSFSSTNMFLMHMPQKEVNFNDKVNFLSRIPARVEDSDKLTIFNYSATSLNYGKCFLSRLIFIKEQLDDTQLEFLMWKVSKEYRDWCKANGYEYAINEMLNN